MKRNSPTLVRGLACLLLGAAALPAAAESDFLFVPGVVSVFEYSEAPPALGLSLKGLFHSGNGFVLNAFELRGLYSFRRDNFRMDLTWPAFFGFLYPGVSMDFKDGKAVPWFYAEVDLFLLPLFVFAMAAKRPTVVPSAFIGMRFGEEGIEGDTGVRISFPLRRKGG